MRDEALARPVWSALTTRQAGVAVGDARAWRFAPEYGVFAAAADGGAASLAALGALVPEGGCVWVVEAAPVVPPAGFVAAHALCLQMAAEEIVDGHDVGFEDLQAADGAEMLALASLTRPGPFFAKTHLLGRFVGVRIGGRLVAMAGERLQGPGFTEVSGVCTHPDFRGRGLAGGLMRVVMGRILARGELPVLHVYASNTGAVALYRTLGFAVRREVTMSVLRRPDA
jgi:predicted GNAT family acetyltransferase